MAVLEFLAGTARARIIAADTGESDIIHRRFLSLRLVFRRGQRRELSLGRLRGIHLTLSLFRRFVFSLFSLFRHLDLDLHQDADHTFTRQIKSSSNIEKASFLYSCFGCF